MTEQATSASVASSCTPAQPSLISCSSSPHVKSEKVSGTKAWQRQAQKPKANGAPQPAPQDPKCEKQSKLLQKQREKEELKAKKEAKAKDKRLHGYKVTMNGEEMLELGQQLLESRDFIFISLDLEMWELDSVLITEIGVAVLDMTKQKQCWTPNIETWHLIPTEAKNKLNGRRIAEKRKLFTQGKSMVMSMAQCRKFWSELIDSLKAKSSNVFFVGQSVKDDLYCLSKNNFDFDKSLPVLDTQLIWESRCSLPCSLGKMLKHVGVQYAFLHNAGNDAYYTLRLLILILDQSVRDKFQLDVGPSRAEADRISREHRKKKSDDPDELPVALSPEDQALKDEEEKLNKMDPITRQKFVAQKKRDREKARLGETLDDMPGKFLHPSEADFAELLAALRLGNEA